MPVQQPRVPVIAVTGHLGAGKTTLLNHLLRQPGARVGVIVEASGIAEPGALAKMIRFSGAERVSPVG